MFFPPASSKSCRMGGNTDKWVKVPRVNHAACSPDVLQVHICSRTRSTCCDTREKPEGSVQRKTNRRTAVCSTCSRKRGPAAASWLPGRCSTSTEALGPEQRPHHVSRDQHARLPASQVAETKAALSKGIKMNLPSLHATGECNISRDSVQLHQHFRL